MAADVGRLLKVLDLHCVYRRRLLMHHADFLRVACDSDPARSVSGMLGEPAGQFAVAPMIARGLDVRVFWSAGALLF